MQSSVLLEIIVCPMVLVLLDVLDGWTYLGDKS